MSVSEVASVEGAASTEAAAPASSRAVRAPKSPAFLRLAIVILTLVAILNSADRYVLTVLAAPMAKELHLSDTELGWLLGIIFALPYTVFGLPLSWMADRVSRPKFLALCVALWSVMTALTGAASSFLTLAAARIGTATGEAGCTPTGHSIISDYFAPEKRPIALSIFGSGAAMGSMTGLVAGGILAAKFGWRMSFVLVGLPGVLVAIVVATVLTETRTSADAKKASQSSGVSYTRTAVSLMKNPVFQVLVLVAGIGSMHAVGVASWVAPLAMRKFGLPVRTVGMFFGFTSGISGIVGMLFGGFITARSGKMMRTWRNAACIAGGCALQLFALTVSDPRLGLAIYAVGGLFMSTWYAPCFAGAQVVAAPQARAQASALVVLVAGIGQGVGPTVVGTLSDGLRGPLGAASLQYSMMIVGAFGFVTAALLYLADVRLRRLHAAAG